MRIDDALQTASLVALAECIGEFAAQVAHADAVVSGHIDRVSTELVALSHRTLGNLDAV